MKISYIIFLLGLGFYSCNKDKNVVNTQNEQNKHDSIVTEEIKNEEQISLEPLQEIPSFSNKDADEFVTNTKLYFEQIAEANKKGETDKILDLQLKAADIDTQFRDVKKKLSSKEQEQLENWYMRLVNAASK